MSDGDKTFDKPIDTEIKNKNVQTREDKHTTSSPHSSEAKIGSPLSEEYSKASLSTLKIATNINSAASEDLVTKDQSSSKGFTEAWQSLFVPIVTLTNLADQKPTEAEMTQLVTDPKTLANLEKKSQDGTSTRSEEQALSKAKELIELERKFQNGELANPSQEESLLKLSRAIYENMHNGNKGIGYLCRPRNGMVEKVEWDGQQIKTIHFRLENENKTDRLTYNQFLAGDRRAYFVGRYLQARQLLKAGGLDDRLENDLHTIDRQLEQAQRMKAGKMPAVTNIPATNDTRADTGPIPPAADSVTSTAMPLNRPLDPGPTPPAADALTNKDRDSDSENNEKSNSSGLASVVALGIYGAKFADNIFERYTFFSDTPWPVKWTATGVRLGAKAVAITGYNAPRYLIDRTLGAAIRRGLQQAEWVPEKLQWALKQPARLPLLGLLPGFPEAAEFAKEIKPEGRRQMIDAKQRGPDAEVAVLLDKTLRRCHEKADESTDPAKNKDDSWKLFLSELDKEYKEGHWNDWFSEKARARYADFFSYDKEAHGEPGESKGFVRKDLQERRKPPFSPEEYCHNRKGTLAQAIRNTVGRHLTGVTTNYDDARKFLEARQKAIQARETAMYGGMIDDYSGLEPRIYHELIAELNTAEKSDVLIKDFAQQLIDGKVTTIGGMGAEAETLARVSQMSMPEEMKEFVEKVSKAESQNIDELAKEGRQLAMSRTINYVSKNMPSAFDDPIGVRKDVINKATKTEKTVIRMSPQTKAFLDIYTIENSSIVNALATRLSNGSNKTIEGVIADLNGAYHGLEVSLQHAVAQSKPKDEIISLKNCLLVKALVKPELLSEPPQMSPASSSRTKTADLDGRTVSKPNGTGLERSLTEAAGRGYESLCDELIRQVHERARIDCELFAKRAVKFDTNNVDGNKAYIGSLRANFSTISQTMTEVAKNNPGTIDAAEVKESLDFVGRAVIEREADRLYNDRSVNVALLLEQHGRPFGSEPLVRAPEPPIVVDSGSGSTSDSIPHRRLDSRSGSGSADDLQRQARELNDKPFTPAEQAKLRPLLGPEFLANRSNFQRNSTRGLTFSFDLDDLAAAHPEDAELYHRLALRVNANQERSPFEVLKEAVGLPSEPELSVAIRNMVPISSTHAQALKEHLDIADSPLAAQLQSKVVSTATGAGGSVNTGNGGSSRGGSASDSGVVVLGQSGSHSGTRSGDQIPDAGSVSHPGDQVLPVPPAPPTSRSTDQARTIPTEGARTVESPTILPELGRVVNDGLLFQPNAISLAFDTDMSDIIEGVDREIKPSELEAVAEHLADNPDLAKSHPGRLNNVVVHFDPRATNSSVTLRYNVVAVPGETKNVEIFSLNKIDGDKFVGNTTEGRLITGSVRDLQKHITIAADPTKLNSTDATVREAAIRDMTRSFGAALNSLTVDGETYSINTILQAGSSQERPATPHGVDALEPTHQTNDAAQPPNRTAEVSESHARTAEASVDRLSISSGNLRITTADGKVIEKPNRVEKEVRRLIKSEIENARTVGNEAEVVRLEEELATFEADKQAYIRDIKTSLAPDGKFASEAASGLPVKRFLGVSGPRESSAGSITNRGEIQPPGEHGYDGNLHHADGTTTVMRNRRGETLSQVRQRIESEARAQAAASSVTHNAAATPTTGFESVTINATPAPTNASDQASIQTSSQAVPTAESKVSSDIVAKDKVNPLLTPARLEVIRTADSTASAAAIQGLTMIHVGKSIYYAFKGDSAQALHHGEAAGTMWAMRQAFTNKNVHKVGTKVIIGTAEKLGGKLAAEGTEKLLGKVTQAGVKIAGREVPILGAGISLFFSGKSALFDKQKTWGDSAAEIASGTGEAVVGTVASPFGLGFVGGEVGRETMNGVEYLITFGKHSGDPSLTRLLMNEGRGLTDAAVTATVAARMIPYIEKSALENQAKISVRAFALADGHQVAIPKMEVGYPKTPKEIQERLAGVPGASYTERLYRVMALSKQEKLSMNPFGSSRYSKVHDQLSQHFRQMETYEDSARQYLEFANRFNQESRPKLIEQLRNAQPYLNGKTVEEIVPILDVGAAQHLTDEPKLTAQKYPDAYALLKRCVQPNVDIDKLTSKQQHHLLREGIAFQALQLSTKEKILGGENYDSLRRAHEQYSQFMKEEYIPHAHKLAQLAPAIQQNEAKVQAMVANLNIIQKREQLAVLETQVQKVEKETAIDMKPLLASQVYTKKAESVATLEKAKATGHSGEKKYLDARADLLMLRLSYAQEWLERSNPEIAMSDLGLF